MSFSPLYPLVDIKSPMFGQRRVTWNKEKKSFLSQFKTLFKVQGDSKKRLAYARAFTVEE